MRFVHRLGRGAHRAKQCGQGFSTAVLEERPSFVKPLFWTGIATSQVSDWL